MLTRALSPRHAPILRRRLWRIRGRVQGVGFRPFVYRLAIEHQLTGMVLNDSAGVVIEAQGQPSALLEFATDIRLKRPALAVITEMASNTLPLRSDESGFTIRASPPPQGASAQIAPDLATCPQCVHELHDATDQRRFGYPLINCTNCGPRFSIVQCVPYDRCNTTMAPFTMCDACRREYLEPADRRFHAQPTACARCGPRISICDAHGELRGPPIAEAVRRLLAGQIVSIKGLGGFHIAVRADDEQAVRRLRERKHRRTKPLALMVANVEGAQRLVRLSDHARRLIASPAAPIILAPRHPHADVAPSVAPMNHRLGVMLAYAPLHHLLFTELGDRATALVMTSANDTDEPLIFTDQEAAEDLSTLCDAIVSHQRPIARPVDDSVVIDAADRPPIIVRRSRGYAPTPIHLPSECRSSGICVGGDLKNVVAVVREGSVILSQHLGDLEQARTYANFKRALDDLVHLFDVHPAWVAHDMHPAYMSTFFARQLAQSLRVPSVAIQHHHAHAIAGLVEHGMTGPALAVVCDGTGFGGDGTIWGGELLAVDCTRFRRLAHLQKFRLPGGDAAAKQAWRSGLSLLQSALGDDFLNDPLATQIAPQPSHASFVGQMLKTGANCVTTTSAGRIFDGVAALLGLCSENSFEAQAPMALESAANECRKPISTSEPLYDLRGEGRFTIDLSPLLREIVRQRKRDVPVSALAALFHDEFAAAWERAVIRAAKQTRLSCVVLSGGVFCNEIIDRELTRRLREGGLHVLRHEHVPPNDGGLALGQAAIAAHRARLQQIGKGV